MSGEISQDTAIRLLNCLKQLMYFNNGIGECPSDYFLLGTIDKAEKELSGE